MAEMYLFFHFFVYICTKFELLLYSYIYKCFYYNHIRKNYAIPGLCDVLRHEL